MNFNAKAIILISGPTSSEIEGVIQSTLKEYSLVVDDVQRIDMAGRLILAFGISLDQAHAPSIEKELAGICGKLGFDCAMELL